MRTNIVIDDGLLAEAMEVTGAKTKREVVEAGLKTLVKIRKRPDFDKYFGKLSWEGDLEAMRLDR